MEKNEKAIQVVCEFKDGNKHIFWFEEDFGCSSRDILKFAKLFGFRNVKFNFGVRLES